MSVLVYQATYHQRVHKDRIILRFRLETLYPWNPWIHPNIYWASISYQVTCPFQNHVLCSIKKKKNHVLCLFNCFPYWRSLLHRYPSKPIISHFILVLRILVHKLSLDPIIQASLAIKALLKSLVSKSKSTLYLRWYNYSYNELKTRENFDDIIINASYILWTRTLFSQK